jgi:GntR family transcriptional regulator/MocR family aminotransferase
MGEPGPANVAEVFTKAGAEVITIGVDGEGLCTQQLPAVCRKHAVKAVYIMPQSHYPTGVRMSDQRRNELMQLAEEYDFVILESDFDHEFWFDARPNVPLAASGLDGRVIYIGVLSRMMPPFSFIAYVAGPAKFITSLKNLWRIIDQQGDVAFEHTMVEMMKNGTIAHCIRKSNNVYQEKREMMATLLNTHLRNYMSFERPSGGLAYWVELNEQTDMPAFLEHCKRKGIFIRPAGHFYFNGKAGKGLRMGFATLSAAEMETGIKAIAAVLQAMHPHPKSQPV